MKYVAGRVGVGLPANVEQADFVSSGVLGLIDAIEKFEPARSIKFEAYAVTLAHRRCIDALRRRSLGDAPLAAGSEARAPETPESLALQRERARLGREVLERIRPACAQLFRLVFDDGLSYRLIARSQGRSEAALRVQMFTCLKRARAEAERLVSSPRQER